MCPAMVMPISIKRTGGESREKKDSPIFFPVGPKPPLPPLLPGIVQMFNQHTKKKGERKERAERKRPGEKESKRAEWQEVEMDGGESRIAGGRRCLRS